MRTEDIMGDGWTSIEQIGRMAAEVMVEGKEESSVVLTLRRTVTESTNGTARWTATIGSYSSKAARSPEEALEEVAGMYRSALLCRIERAEERLRAARAALPTDHVDLPATVTDEERLRMTEGGGAALGRALAGVDFTTGTVKLQPGKPWP